MLKKYQALMSFEGIIRMDKDQVKKLDSESVHVQDLVRAKLLKEVKPTRPKRSKKK